ncbi:MAG: bifunctional diguanylate cyclase/phosphodiesterase [bacterium]
MTGNTEFKIAEKFLFDDENLEITAQDLLIDACKFYNMSRLIFYIKNYDEAMFEPIVIYENNKKEDELVYKISKKIFSNFLRYTAYNHNNNTHEERFIKECLDKIYFSKKNAKDILGNLNISQKNLNNNFDNPNGYIIKYIPIKGLFMYFLMESDDEILEEDVSKLAVLLKMLDLKIEKENIERDSLDNNKIKEAIVDSEGMPICIVDKTDHRILDFNSIYDDILPHINDCTYYYELIGKTREFSIQDSINTKYVKAGGKHWVRKNIELVLNDGREVYIIYGKDTQDHIKQLESLDLLTSTLSLKGLSSYYNDVIRKSIYSHVLVTLDILHFKDINAKYGFEMGNNLLKNIAVLIKESLIGEEMFCRINDDKFAIIFRKDEDDFSTDRYKSLKEKFNKLKDGNYCFNALKIYTGICDIDKTLEFNILLDRSNMAKNSIKGHYSKEIAFYDKTIEKQIQKEFFIEERTSYAVDNNEFTLFLQPKFNLQENTICGAEALVRWVTPEGMIYPDEFIPLFEKNGFISNLDFIIYEKVMQYIKHCLYNSLPVYPISINVSRIHINEDDFVKRFMNLVYMYNIPVELIELEIIESAFMNNERTLKEFVNSLKSYNLKISVDDFGTDYSSLHLLSTLEVDTLKIDKSFLDDVIEFDEENYSKDILILKNIVNLANDLKMSLICEGIETDEQIELLKAIGCKMGQGYVFSRPISTEDYEKKYLI